MSLLGAVVIWRGRKWRVSEVLTRGRLELAALDARLPDLGVALAENVSVVEVDDDPVLDELRSARDDEPGDEWAADARAS